MQIRKIFLASSAELKDDRREFELMIGRLNQQWRPRDVVFEVTLWEDFIDAMSPGGLQKEYNKAVADCDIFVMMFFTKVGRYTLEEFETAFAKMQAGGGPRVFTYFRNDFVLTGDIDEGITSLLAFKARLRELHHYVTVYRNTQDLQYQFSQQLEKLYGEEGADAQEIDDGTTPVKAGEIALLLAYRHLYGSSKVDLQRLGAATERASRQVRNTLFQMASEMRRENWVADKRLMERSIPILEALTRSDPDWHAPWGQLGYALVDKVSPDWRRGKECLDRAVELRGDAVPEGRYHNYNRARCAVQLDPAFAATPRSAAEPASREAVLDLVKLAKRDLEANWDEALKWPSSEGLRDWLALNGSTRRRG
jgi:hypothetical protein